MVCGVDAYALLRRAVFDIKQVLVKVVRQDWEPVVDGNSLQQWKEMSKMRLDWAVACASELWKEEAVDPRNNWSGIHLVRILGKVNEAGSPLGPKQVEILKKEETKLPALRPPNESLEDSSLVKSDDSIKKRLPGQKVWKKAAEQTKL